MKTLDKASAVHLRRYQFSHPSGVEEHSVKDSSHTQPLPRFGLQVCEIRASRGSPCQDPVFARFQRFHEENKRHAKTSE